MERVLTGEQSPMFFGSAMTNFGVELFLKRFLTIGQKPAARRMGVSDMLCLCSATLPCGCEMTPQRRVRSNIVALSADDATLAL